MGTFFAAGVACALLAGCGGRVASTDEDAGTGTGTFVGCRPGDPPMQLAIQDVSALALDKDYVYFSGGGGLQRVSKRGGPVESYPRANGAHSALVIAGDWIYFADGSIGRVSKSGGEPQILAKGTGRTWWLDVRDPWLYVARTATDGSGAETLEKISLADGSSIPLFSSSVMGQPAVISAALAGQDVVFAVAGERRVLAVPQSGGPPSERFTNVWVTNVTSHGDTAYATVVGPFTGGLGSAVVRLPMNANPDVIVLPPMTMAFGALATDGAFVYFVDVQERALKKVETKPGSVPTKIVSLAIALLAVDDACVYYFDRGKPSLVRAPK